MHTSPAISGILYDFGNVLSRFDHGKSCRRLGERCGMSGQEVRTLLFPALTQRHETGELPARAFYAEVCSVLGLSGMEFSVFEEIWNNIFTQNPGIEALIGRVRPSVRRAIVSNTDPIHWKRIKLLPVMQRYFSDPALLTLSYQVGARKPDRAIFDDALARIGLPVDGVVYVDDIPEYAAAFKALGGNAIQYDCSKDPIDVLEEGLAKYGLLQ